MDNGRDRSLFSKRKCLSVLSVLFMMTAGLTLVIIGEDGTSLPAGDLIVHYSFDEGEKQVAKNSVSANWKLQLGESDGVDGTDPKWAPGIVNSSLEFDGVDDYAICNPFDFPSTTFSLMFWVNIQDNVHDSFPVSYAVEDEDNEILIGFRSQIHIEVNWPNETDIDVDLRDGLWHHFAMTWENADGDIAVYIDGAEEYSGTLSKGESVIQGGSLILGYEQDEVGGGFQDNQGLVGKMDEFAIYGSYLSDSEILSIYSSYGRPIEGLDATPGGGYVDLNWDSVDDPEVKQYNVYRADPEMIQNGLMGKYYDNPNMTDLKFERVDDVIDFDWGSGTPDPSITGTDLSISWTGYLRATRTGIHDFYTQTENGVRVWIDGKLLLDDWDESGSIENEFQILLDTGYHKVRIDFYKTDTSDTFLKFEVDDGAAPRMVYPGSRLFTFNMTDFQKIGSVNADNFRDSGLETDRSYFYYVTYELNSGWESPISEIVGGAPSFTTTMTVDPTTRSMTIGSTFEFKVYISNDGRIKDWFELDVEGLDASWWEFDENEFYLDPDEFARASLFITVPESTSEGMKPFQVTIYSQLNSISQPVDVWVDVFLDPVIHDLRPRDDYRSGSATVMFSWETDVMASTVVYLKKSNETEFQKHEREDALIHMLNITDLERQTTYDFYVETTSDYGSTISEERSFEVDNGVEFFNRYYRFEIDRNYNQLEEITIQNKDDRAHSVIATIDNPYDDLIVGFVGAGSTDRIMSIRPGWIEKLEIAFHAQDSMRHRYDLVVNLTTIPEEGEEALETYARISVTLNHLFVNMTITELSMDPYTLTKRIRITNDDDPVTDVRVYAQDEIADYIRFEPSINHGYLATDQSIEIEVSPLMNFVFTSLSGKVFVSAYNKVYSIDLVFEPPEDWEVFAASIYPNWGGFPFVEIDPDDIDMDGVENGVDPDKDGDGILNIEELFLSMDTDNDGLPNHVDLDDDGDGNPDASDIWRIDFDNDWIPNYIDDDRDGDGIDNDEDDHPDDLDNDGVNSGNDNDDDNDRVKDGDDFHPQDHDNDGENDDVDNDDDNDGQDDAVDNNPYDQDNDGDPDYTDSDWKDGGPASPTNPTWNPNPRPGGSPGSWGGGGGSDSDSGEDWYCTNKPELDWWDLLKKIAQLALLGIGIAKIFIGATPVGMVTNFLFFLGQWGLKELGKMGYKSLTGKTLREDVAKYYPDFERNTSRAASALITDKALHHYWQEEINGYVQIRYVKTDVLMREVLLDQVITSSEADSMWPNMEIDDHGRLYLVWVDYRDGNGEIYQKASYNGGVSWENERRITDHSGDADDPKMVVDSNGRGHLTWVDMRDGNEEIYYTYSDDLMNWETEQRLTNSPGPSRLPVIAVDGDDTVHLVYSDDGSVSSEVFYRKSTNGGETWSSAYQLSDSDAGAGEPAMRITESGVVHVVWRDSKNGESEIYYRKSADSGDSFETEIRLTVDASYSEYPDLLSQGEDIALLWHDDRTGVDLSYFRYYNSTRDEWSLVKRLPVNQPRIDSLYLEIEMHPSKERDVEPHDFYIMLDDIEIGSIINEVPDGKYVFELPLEILAPMTGAIYEHELKIMTRHMNPGHYVISANWKLSWHWVTDFKFICAPDQYAADQYLRNNMSVHLLTEDPSIYANNIILSDRMPNVNDTIQLTAEITNPGGNVAENVEIRFYEMEPGNESRRIGDPVIIDFIGQYGSEIVTMNWTAVKNVSRIYVVVDPQDNINELDETNNEAYIRLVVLQMTPPSGSLVINDGSPFAHKSWIFISFNLDSANEVTHVAFSNDNVTWSDWRWYTDPMSWNLDSGTGSRSYSVGDGFRTVYVKFKDIGGLISEVISAEIELFSHYPTVLNFSAEGGVIANEDKLSIEFSNPMDEDSVRSAFLVTPSMDGSFTWDNRTLHFTPNGNWTVGETYNVSITSDAFDFKNRLMETDYLWNFTVAEGGTGDDDEDDDDIENQTDTDGDGIPDWWEDLYGLNKTDPNDADGDLDNDTFSNIDEYEGGSDPTDPNDVPDDGDDGSNGSGLLIAMIVSLILLFVVIMIIVFVVVLAVRKNGEDEEDWEE